MSGEMLVFSAGYMVGSILTGLSILIAVYFITRR